MKNALYLLLGFLGLVLGQTDDDIILQTGSPDSVKYALDSYVGYCEPCLGFNLESSDRGRFRLLYEELREIDNAGNECCAAGETGCTANVGCNRHAMWSFPNVFTETYTNTTARINGTAKASGASGTCTPGTIEPSGSVCATYDWYYELVNETTNITIGGYTFPLYKNMLLIRFTISNWVFVGTSQGIRLKMGWGTESVTCEHWYMNPGGVEVDDDDLDVFASNYSSCRAKDFYDHTGEVFLTPYALRNNVEVVPVTVKGPINYNEPDSREFTIDFPQFSSSMTYYMGAAVPKASGLGKAGRMTASMAATLGLVVLPFIL